MFELAGKLLNKFIFSRVSDHLALSAIESLRKWDRYDDSAKIEDFIKVVIAINDKGGEYQDVISDFVSEISEIEIKE